MKVYLILIIPVGLLVGGVAGYFFVNKENYEKIILPTTLAPLSGVVGTKKDVLKLDQSVIWKTYHNEKYGFEIKYPPEYSAEEGPYEENPEQFNQRIFFGAGTSDNKYKPFENFISVNVNVGMTDLYGFPGADSPQRNDVVVGGRKAKQYMNARVNCKIEGCPIVEVFDCVSDLGRCIYSVSNGKDLFRIGVISEEIELSYKANLEKMIKTLRFIDSELGVADVIWGIPSLPQELEWYKITENAPYYNFNNYVLHSRLEGKAELKGVTYSSIVQMKNNLSIFEYYGKAMGKDWVHSVIDPRDRVFSISDMDGMRGSSSGRLKVMNGQLRIVTWSEINTSKDLCYSTPEKPCAPQIIEYRIFISDPILLNDLPGEPEAIKG